MVIFPNLTQLDITGPYEIFGRFPGAKVFLVAETFTTVKSDTGFSLTPDKTFDSAEQADIIFVPGGRGIFDAMQNKKLINFLQQQELIAEQLPYKKLRLALLQTPAPFA